MYLLRWALSHCNIPLLFSQASVSHSVHGGGCLLQCMLWYTPQAGTLQGGTPPMQVHPWTGTHPRQVPSQHVHPQAGTPPPPGYVHPLDRYTPRQVHPWTGTPLGRYTLGRYPLAGNPPAGTPSFSLPLPLGQVHPPAGTPTRQVHPPGRYTPW